MSFDTCFKGKNVLVTGAGRGIGRALAVALHSRGAKVYAVSRTLANLESLKKELPNIIPICVDLGDWEATREALLPLERMDSVINNAGVCEAKEFLKVTPKDFDWHMDINLKSVINVSQVAAEKMIEEGKPGSIVNISSIAGKRAEATITSYCCTKAALEMLSNVMAIELGPHKITVNCINPGLVETDMSNPLEMGPEDFKQFVPRTPTGNIWNPMDDVVNATLFFASGITSNITGVSLPVDGGYLIT